MNPFQPDETTSDDIYTPEYIFIQCYADGRMQGRALDKATLRAELYVRKKRGRHGCFKEHQARGQRTKACVVVISSASVKF